MENLLLEFKGYKVSKLNWGGYLIYKDYSQMGLSKEFLLKLIELVSDSKFKQNFTQRDYIHSLCPDDIYPLTLRTIVAQIGNIQICKGEDLGLIYLVTQDNDLEVDLELLPKLKELISKDSQAIGSIQTSTLFD